MAQIDEIKIQTHKGERTIPVYSTGDFSYDALRIKTPNGTGAIKLEDTGTADFPEIRVQTPNGTKAFSQVAQTFNKVELDTSVPELNVNATLNSQTAAITVYEDTTLDGTPDNTEEVSLSNGSNTYSLSNISGGTGNDYWLEIELESVTGQTAMVTV